MGSKSIQTLATFILTTIAGPTGGLIGTLTGGLIASIIPGAELYVTGIVSNLSTEALKLLGDKVVKKVTPQEKLRLNHDLQAAFQDAVRQSLYDIGGEACFKNQWQVKKRDVPIGVTYPLTPQGNALWAKNKALADQICNCLKAIDRAADDGTLILLEPPVEQTAADVRQYLKRQTADDLADAFFEQVITPQLGDHKLMLAEAPDFHKHLRANLLNRTLVHLGELFKERTVAWRAFNRLILEELRDEIAKVHDGQADISAQLSQLNNLLAHHDPQALSQLSDTLAELLTAVGQIEKHTGEDVNTLISRVTVQHQELVAHMHTVIASTRRIEIKVEQGFEKVLRVLEDGREAVGAEAAVEEEPPAPGEPPYKGMAYFDEGDAELFFGREFLVAKLVGQLRQHRFLAVIVGASGSGKSSIVRAGIVPTLRRGEALADGTLPPEGSQDWQVHIIKPTAHPLESLAARLTNDSESITATSTLIDDLDSEARALHLFAVKKVGSSNRLLLVVDQFEEIFTLCHNEAERKAFIDNLMTATSPESDGPTTVIITLRADFYEHCAQYANLREAVAKRQEFIGSMSRDELRQAIESPARKGGWELEPGLVEVLLHEVGDEPGALPLLSHALLETWKRRRGRLMTMRGYAESGGVHGAIAKTADFVYGQFSPEQQGIARNIFLRLTELGEGTQDTRRRVSLTELLSKPTETSVAQTILNTLSNARLLTIDDETVEVAHEALIREWPTLRGWLNEDREGLRLHRQLTKDAGSWAGLNRDEGALYRGARLAQVGEWAEKHADDLSASEREFVNESHARHVSELEAAKKRAAEQKKINRRLRNALFGARTFLAVAICAACAATGTTGLAIQQSFVSLSRQLAAQAQNQLNDNPLLAVLLALEARQFWETDEANGVLATAPYVFPPHSATFQGHTDFVTSVAWSPDGQQLASGSYDNTIIVWDLTTRQARATLKAHVSHVLSVAWSPDGRQLATGSEDSTIIVWDVATGQPQATLKGSRIITSVAWSPDGQQLASGSWDNTIVVWDVATGQVLATLKGHTDFVNSIVWSPGGKQLASGSGDNTIIVWDVATGQALATLKGHTDRVQSVAWSPDGQQLASGSSDNTIIVWDGATGQAIATLKGHSNYIQSVAWSPDSKQLASGSSDNTIIVWDVATGQAIATLKGHTSWVYSVAWSPDGQQLASGSADNTMSVWDVTSEPPQATLKGHSNDVLSVAWSPDSKQLASGSYDNTIIVWDAASGQVIATLKGHSETVTSVAWSPDGKQMASGSWDSTIVVWDVSTEQALATMKGNTDSVLSVAWSPDGTQLTAGSGGKTITMWDVATGQATATLKGHTGAVISVAWSPDGRQLASGSEDNTIIMWDVATGQATATLKGHTGGVISVAWSPDGRQLASGSSDNTIIVWDVATGQVMATLRGHASWVYSVAWSPDGKQLASGSRDSNVRLLVTQFTHPACEWVTRNLTQAEWKQYMPGYLPYHKTCEQWPDGQ